MPPLVLEGDTLGEKHKNFNKLVHDAVTNKQINLSNINYDDTDVQNLLSIHTACKIRNVDYILEVLKCDDMLYISTAIKQSTWLITDQQYAHIVNPQYLYTQLFPHMTTKAINKFLLHIRLHLKDEKRVEAFYDYIKNIFSHDEAEKWLLNCSITFIENILQKELNISLKTYKRLCKLSVKFLPNHKKVVGSNAWQTLDTIACQIKSNTEEYMDLLDTITEHYHIPQLNKKHTKLIMKKCPERILDNFERYIGNVDLAVVAKHIKKENIKDFLKKHVQNNNIKHHFSDYNKIKHFIKQLPNEDRFEFVKRVYIDKIEDKMHDGTSSACLPACSVNTYEWYQYAPFSIALTELKKLIRAESSPAERCAMLSVMITCAGKNLDHAKTVLEYYYDKHRNEPFKFKIQFVNNVITKMSTHEFDSETWTILDKLFHSLEVYIESDNDVQLCLRAIVVYKILHNENIPDIIEKKLEFDTFVKFKNKLNDTQRNPIFNYLLTFISNKINNKTVVNESDFDIAFNLLKNSLDLLNHWKRDIKDHTFIRDKIQALIEVKKQNAWQTNLSSLYDVNKSWRRHLFEKSLMLCPSERVCLNALKHEPQLLNRYHEETSELRTNDNITLKNLLTKFRIYWPNSLAQQWIDAYFNNINKPTGQKAVAKGLSVLLPQNQFEELARKYVPKDSKIDWNEINQTELSVIKNIVKYFHKARPMIPLDIILWYAKGDYLQYAVPSLNAIIYNMSRVKSSDYIPKLLDAPVSLQKYGLHLAFIKLDYEDLKTLFSNIWQTTSNLTIRAHLFTYTYNLLRKVKEATHAEDLWEVLNMFISNLTANENKDIYGKLGKPYDIHISVRGKFLMKSYIFLTSLPPAAGCDSQIKSLIRYAPDMMDLLDAEFVTDNLLAPIEQKIGESSHLHINVMSSYVLHGKTEANQCERFQHVLLPALEHILKSWNLVKNERYVMKSNIDELLRILTYDVRKYLTLRKIVVPTKLFTEVRTFMEQKMNTEENYIRYTSWKLITEYVKLVAEHAEILSDARFNNISSTMVQAWLPDEAEQVWEELHVKLSPKLGSIIVNHLKEDTENYFPTICWLFSKALENVFSYLSYNRSLMIMETLKHMVLNEDYIPSYIVVCDQMPKYGNDEDKKKREEVRKILLAHSAQEVQMHYYKAFGDLIPA